jgi:hypothetical protein
MSEKLSYSNPRMSAVIENWPLGGSKRGVCTFRVEVVAKKGERATRQTTGAIKKKTFARKVRIVGGSDGRIYILELSMSDCISVCSSDMQHDVETIWPRDDAERYSTIRALFETEV